MIYVILGILTFPVMYFFDYLQLKHHPGKAYVGFIGFGGLAVIVVKLMVYNVKLTISPILSSIGWVISIIFLILLMRSLIIEIPFYKTYIGKRKEQKLVDTGAYALTRHPGVLWLLFSLMGLALASKSYYLLLAALIYTVANGIYVYFQENILIQMISGYENYQQQVPMLIPTKKSINNYINGIGRKSL